MHINAASGRARRLPPTIASILALGVMVALSGCTRSSVEQPPDPPPPTPEASVESAEPSPEPSPEPEPEPEPKPEPTLSVAERARAPMTDEQRRLFTNSAEDPPTEVRLGVTRGREGKHYLAGNEKTLQVYYPLLKDIGGSYVGVGSDQAYILIGWAKPEFAWLIDYDPEVVAIHSVYKAFFAANETPEEFLELWTEDGRPRGKKILAEAYPDEEERKRLQRLYLRYRGWINRRLQAVRRRFVKADVPSFLNDQATYDHIQAMLEVERIRPLLANLLDDEGVAGVATAARELGVPIRLLYLSNAEEYWKRYSDQFRANIKSFTFDERSIVVRTLLTWRVNEDYVYNSQPALNYLRWLEHPAIRNVYDIAHARPKAVAGEIKYFEVNTMPEDSPAARKAAERAELRAECKRKPARDRPKTCSG